WVSRSLVCWRLGGVGRWQKWTAHYNGVLKHQPPLSRYSSFGSVLLFAAFELWCMKVFGVGFPKSAPYGTSLWRFCSAIHGSANFWKASPKALPGPLCRHQQGLDFTHDP